MESYKLIHEILDLVEQYENTTNSKEVTLHGFAGFIITQIGSLPETGAAPDVRFGTKENPAQQLAYQIDNNIGRLFIYMSRYAKNYIKKALDGTPLQTAEEFTYLAILLTHDDMSKSDLINQNLQEKTSGTEVIRRLINAGLIKQRNDEKDKRSRRISITEEGKELMYRVFDDMNHVGKMVTGDLTMAEKLMLQYILQKLEAFHYHHYERKTIADKEDLLAFQA